MRNKWTPDKAHTLARRIASGESIKELSRCYGVSPQALYRIIRKYQLPLPRKYDDTMTTSERHIIGQTGVNDDFDLEDVMPLPKICPVSKERLTYTYGSPETATLIQQEDGTWLIVSRVMSELMCEYPREYIKQLSEWYDSRLRS